MNRREFSSRVIKGTAGIGLSSRILSGNSWKGSNDRVNIAIIGIRGQGQNHISSFSAVKNTRVAALCDVDSNLLDERIKKHFTDKGLEKPRIYTDMRKHFEDKDIDAVSVVTPNHWHALASIWALQSGKDVTVEKPCCHNFYEGMKLMISSQLLSISPA